MRRWNEGLATYEGRDRDQDTPGLARAGGLLATRPEGQGKTGVARARGLGSGFAGAAEGRSPPPPVDPTDCTPQGLEAQGAWVVPPPGRVCAQDESRTGFTAM